MVTNSFGKRNFMLPMGRPKHALKVPSFFFLLSFVGKGFFFSFFHGPHYVPFKFS
jgi:hypothetical protein